MKTRCLPLVLGFCASLVFAQETPVRTLFTNVHVFDGVHEKRIENANVLIEDNLISAVSSDPIEANDATVIDGGGRTMIPGLIDVHWHLALAELPMEAIIFGGDAYEVGIRMAHAAPRTLMRGFTTVRDMGGNTFSLKKLIDAGEVVGPRILPAGPMISQTGGHFDYRMPNQVPDRAGTIDYWGRVGMNAVADGVPAVRQRAREAFMLGATQLKIAGGGGVASTYDPVDVRQYSFEEMQAAVDVAESYNSYVGAHIFTDDAVQMAVKAGIKSIEHGMLIGEDTLKLMKKNDVWLSIQPILNDDDAEEFPNPESNRKFVEVTKGTDTIYRLAKKMGVKMAFGTDLFMSAEAAAKQGKFLAKLTRWFTPYEALKMATSDNAELMELSGPRHPYKQGSLGVLKTGAYADLILVDGNPLDDLNLVADPENNFDLIMKDGKIYKNTL
ncbi:amidohydrolase family protein [Aestuariicella hydrocarbonica]|uniref:Amidohydrolase family protein n=1 Tax=Pseudomaricurvus hydrocarbonicus TaxID=1470433 RepID=A0A9E5MHN9_9GAMM|nr:amidohydrolase family protein [Aestuariicella hydrocarbonica]NHO66186.1 amidohydrolase family protein [Aestuariicella hydrocarbonica]